MIRQAVLLLNILILISAEGRCYSCSGTCHSEHCNCQMGSCPSNQCFIEKKPTEENGVFRITKGCLRRSPRTFPGCEYDHFNDHILCVCNGTFCNDRISLKHYATRNVTCRKCTDKNPDCSNTCVGQWCYEDSSTGRHASGCGYGPPSLPFFHKGPELLPFRNKICVSLSRNQGVNRKHCICASHMCNSYTKTNHLAFHMSHTGVLKSRSLNSEPSLSFHTCVNCDVNTHDHTASTSSCKSNRCTGHFCTFVAQRHFSSIPGRGTSFSSVSEKQGCINVTDSTMVQLGCTKKWMHKEYEEILCACQGNLCNRDEGTASSALFNFSLITVLSILYFV